MKNILTIFKRDLASFFTSPIGYMFMVVFLLISVGLYMTAFFTFPVADMRGFFSNLPILFCVFIPAVTMRVWAEERKENTWEMLLTFPMKASELVLGKFLACFAFFALTIAATVTVPLMLVRLGNPDNGAIFGGYFGTLLLGAFFLSIGIFFSGFCKDQILAFVVTLLACFAIFLLGTGFIAAYIDGAVPGLGSLLSQLVGVTDHYNAFTRGVIEAGDVLYFVVWTALFLVLNVMYIEGRNRPGAKMTFGASLAASCAIGLAFNWLITGQSILRLDLTEDQIYTVSKASKSILSRVEDPVQVKLYITPKDKMPTEFNQLEQDIADKIEELRVASGGKIAFSTIYLEAANVMANPEDPFGEDKKEGEKTEEKAIEERMLDKGVTPFSVRAIAKDAVTSKLIYSSIGVGYRDKTEEIIPQVVPQTLPDLEYRLVSTIYKLTREKEPVVALVAPKEAINIPPQQRQLLMQLGQPIPESEDPYETLERILAAEKYRVERVELTKESKLPGEFDTLVVINPRGLNDRQKWEINRALYGGKSVILAVQHYEYDYRPTRSGISLSQRREEPGVNDLLAHYGVTVEEDVLMDVNHVPLNISTGNALTDMLGMGQPVDLPTHILLNNESMDQETAIASRLSMIFYLWGTALKLDEKKLEENKLEWRVLMRSSEKAWTFPGGQAITPSAFDEPVDGGQAYPLMAMLSGQFPDAYAGKPRPAWPAPQPAPGQFPPPPADDEPEGEPARVEPKPGKLVVLGCSEMFRKDFLRAAPGNLDLFMNAVDAVTLTDDIAYVRGRKPIDRVITAPDGKTKSFWKFVNYTSMSSLIALAGAVTMTVRRQARNAYTMAHVGD